MAKITRFEDIDAWKKARELTSAIYAVCRTEGFARDFGLRDQIRAAAVSAMSNIAEGYERDGNAEFRQFLYIAKASPGEVRSQLYVALDAGYIDELTFRRLTALAMDTIRLIRGFIRYLDNSEMHGQKFL